MSVKVEKIQEPPIEALPPTYNITGLSTKEIMKLRALTYAVKDPDMFAIWQQLQAVTAEEDTYAVYKGDNLLHHLTVEKV